MQDAAKHTRNLNTSMKLICPRFILEILEILMMFRTIRQPNNMYAGNNEGGKFTFLEIYLNLTHFLSGKVQLIMIIPIHPLLLATNIWRPLLKGYFSSCQPSLQLNKAEQFSAFMDFNLPTVFICIQCQLKLLFTFQLRIL